MPRGGNQSDAHSCLIASVRDYLKVRGAFVYKVWGNAFGKGGMPDSISALPVWLGGRRVAVWVAVECKTGSATLTKLQREVKAELEAAGVLYVVCRQLEDLEDALVDAGLVEYRALLVRRSG